MPPVPITISISAPPGSTHLSGAARNSFLSFELAKPITPTTNSPQPVSANQRRKATVSAAICQMNSVSSSQLSTTMTPLNVTIIARCLARLPENASPPNAGGKRRSGNHTPATSPAPLSSGPAVHPYSRASDLANTRSTIPSPQELARAERAEEEKARQKKENAAAARAAAALARRRKANRSTTRVSRMSSAAPMIPAIVRATGIRSQLRARTVEPTDSDLGDDDTARASSLKRTRSSGLTSVITNIPAAVSVASPLRTVAASADDSIENDRKRPASDGSDHSDATESGPTRKRSRLATEVSTRATRRANTTSPVSLPAGLSDEPAVESPARPRRNLDTLAAEPMRRVVSAADATANRRNGSAGPDSAMVRERSRREVLPPANLRDYDR